MMKPMIFRAKIATLLKWEIILVAIAIVLYDKANDFSGQNSNIETGGGGLQVNFP